MLFFAEIFTEFCLDCGKLQIITGGGLPHLARKIGARETIFGIASFVGADPLCASRTAPTSKDPQAVRKDPEGGQESFASCGFVFFCLNARRRAISKAISKAFRYLTRKAGDELV